MLKRLKIKTMIRSIIATLLLTTVFSFYSGAQEIDIPTQIDQKKFDPTTGRSTSGWKRAFGCHGFWKIWRRNHSVE